MAKSGNPITLQLFVASPGDVEKERQVVRQVVAELEGTIGSYLALNIKSFLWEDDLGPGVHSDGPQGLVDAHSNLKVCDILVGIFWNRLGTPAADGKTGTEHEVQLSYERWKSTQKPQIMIYFSQKPISQTTESIKQAELLLSFKQRLPKDIFTWQHKSAQHFEKLFREHLTRHVMQVWSDQGRPIDPVHFPHPDHKLGLVATAQDLIRINTEIVSEAEEVFYATGSRSRDDSYLRAIERRLEEAPRVVHYRVLFGPPFRTLFKDHLLRLLTLRPAADRAMGYKTIHLGLFEDLKVQAEVFIAGNEKRVLIVLPSRQGIGEYNNALVIDEPSYVHDIQHFVKQLYAASTTIETRESIERLHTVLN